MSAIDRSAVRELIADELGVDVDEVERTDDLAALEGWDSLRRLNVMLALEEMAGVVLEPDDLDELSSVDRIVALVDARSA